MASRLQAQRLDVRPRCGPEVAPEQPGQLTIVGQWGARRESSQELAARVSAFLLAVEAVAPEAGPWKESDRKLTAVATDVDTLAKIIHRGRHKNGIPPYTQIEEAGYIQSIESVDVKRLYVRVAAGAWDVDRNDVTVQIPRTPAWLHDPRQ